jgi:diguanylate cyclase (GGDEF)-like protein/PAS domain S-box-containing protein
MTGDIPTPSEGGLAYESLFRAAPAACVIVAADDNILDVNDEFTAMTGLCREDVVGTSFLRLLPMGDRILFSTRSQPLLDLTGRVSQIEVSILGEGRVRVPATLSASRVMTDPARNIFVLGPRRERSVEEAQLISAVHRAEASDTRRHRAETDLQHQSDHDALTGLLNRAGLMKALHDTVPQQDLVVYWVGLDHFRVINESLGRSTGDEILTTIARRLRQRWADDAVLARVGGDEFVLTSIGPDYADHAEAILRHIADPVVVAGLEIIVSASIGVSTVASVAADRARPQAAVGETLLRDAGTGMYEAKAAGRSRWKHFAAVTDDSAINEIRLLGEIRGAITGDQLRLEYQPQLNLRTGLLHGFEALIRWDHPDRGLIGPDGFIDVAEKTGLISQLGTWACHTAIAQATVLGGVPGAPPSQMSVNISARQLSDSHFAGTIESVLEASTLEPARLTLELTESGIITDGPQARANIQRLDRLGVRLSIDDFGTGHAGFAYLNDFPIDEIKIDRSFVKRLGISPDATAIVTSCIELAHALNVSVVAEGVETTGQLTQVTELGCDIAQGFYYSRPLSPEKLPLWMESSSTTQTR